MILRNITSSEPGDEFDQKRAEGLCSAIWLLVLNSFRSRAAACALDLKGGDFGELIQQSTNGSCMPAPYTATATRGNIEVKLQLYDQQVNKPSSKPLSGHAERRGRRPTLNCSAAVLLKDASAVPSQLIRDHG